MNIKVAISSKRRGEKYVKYGLFSKKKFRAHEHLSHVDSWSGIIEEDKDQKDRKEKAEKNENEA